MANVKIDISATQNVTVERGRVLTDEGEVACLNIRVTRFDPFTGEPYTVTVAHLRLPNNDFTLLGEIEC